MWQLPTGIFIILGAQAGGRLINRFGSTTVVRVGLFSYLFGIVLIYRVIGLGITEWTLLPGLAFYGIGIGFAGAQLTNVVLSEVPKESSGVASGANTTMRQVGAALGVAIIGSILTVQTLRSAVSRLTAADLPPTVRAHALAGVHVAGSGYVPPPGTAPHDAGIVQHALQLAVTSGTRLALAFAIVVVFCGCLLSFLIPKIGAPVDERADTLEPLEPMDVDPALREMPV